MSTFLHRLWKLAWLGLDSVLLALLGFAIVEYGTPLNQLGEPLLFIFVIIPAIGFGVPAIARWLTAGFRT